MKASAVLVLCLLQAYLASSVLVPHARLSPSQLREKALQLAAVRYSNDWAVQIEGSLETVNTIASTNGFINMGQVSLWLSSKGLGTFRTIS